MNIRPKFMLILFAISLIPIIISNGIFFYYAKESINTEVINHLESVASIQHAKIRSIYQQNIERLRLVASRTQLRISLNEFNQNKKTIYQNKMSQILSDAIKSIDDFTSIHVHALNGTVIASTDTSTIGMNHANNPAFKEGLKKNQATIFAHVDNKKLMVFLSGPLYLKDKLLGVLVIESSTQNILSSVSDYTGLGESGETVLAVQNEQGEAVFLMPARFDKGAALNLTISKEQKNIPINYAINGVNKVFTDFVDYRNVPVISVTRHINEANWGIVVKIDKSEALAYLNKMQNILIIIIIATSLLVIIVSIVMSKQITQPLIRLFDASKRVAAGKVNQQVDIVSNDEIGKLAEAFNHMLKMREQYVDELEQKTVELTYATQLKSEFLANMSHELRTPMNSIIGFTSRVLKKSSDKLDERQVKNLRTVVRNANHLLSLINSLLDLSKIETGKMEAHAELFDLTDVADEVFGLTKSLLTNKPIEFIVDIPPDMIQLNTDNIKLKQILINLVTNAIKFTHEGTITISAQLLESHKDKGGIQLVTIRVTDTGVGMHETSLKYIFDAFRQVDGSMTRKVGGTGLGLAIVRNFTEILKGKVTVKSQEGVGTTFEITIPVNLDGKVTETRFSQLSSTQLQKLSIDKKTILCIDDEAEVRELINDYLVDEGYQVVTARDADEGIAIAKQIKPFAITLDILMPHKDGWSVLSELKSYKETRNIPIFIISFLDNNALAYHLGAFSFMQKPINPEQLINGIKNLPKDSINSALVVDDNPEARDLLKQILDDVDISCQFAVSGHNALQILEACKKEIPELILLDLMMPDMDGFEFLEKMQQNPLWTNIPVIVVTAKTLEEHEEEFLKSRVASIQTKDGLTAEQVLKQISSAMNNLK